MSASENRERLRAGRESIGGMELLDRDACYRAVQCRDPRFDGRLFVGVVSTGIYCRPVCPARTPKLDNCRFFNSAAAAQEAGLRPCLRCRPESAPDLASWRGTSNTVARALGLIARGALDGEGAGVDDLAARLGVGGRQLRRLFKQHLGASPVAVSQTRRVLFAKQLIHETDLPMTEVALAAGFGSVRRFNETFHDLFGRPPSALRGAGAHDDAAGGAAGVTLRVRYRSPYDWDAMLEHLHARAVEGVERVEDGAYVRTASHDGQLGTVEVRNEAGAERLAVTVRFPCVRALQPVLDRVRRLFDVAADVEAIGAHLSRDTLLAPLVARRPGLRVPGGWDEFEVAVRAILGQQVTVSVARILLARLTAICGERLACEDAAAPGLTTAFPSPKRLAAADLGALGMPAARRDALRGLAEAVLADPDLLRPRGSLEESVARLRDIRGIGEWTAQYVALRALRETDAFPSSDVALLRATGAGERPTPEALERRAESWRPWRAYAAQHLWADDSHAAARTAKGGCHG
jgi:AraC family transcriptional regulator of adaptative response / DNA-3-methyladenine glycosylase II